MKAQFRVSQYLNNSQIFIRLNLWKRFVCCFCLGLFCYSAASYSQEQYFLCGPDEDGCFEDVYQYCACIPYNEKEANKPYCLNFDELTCNPLSQVPDCDPGFVYRDQGSCLAVIYQSIAEPPCPLTTKSFCLENHTSICNEDGRPESCH
ncbi:MULTISPECIES: hypothetical protein [unclassified Legionella]|uniref:hypothetical protein n=1 Tax=unclassified Legionella TaxID=2622702 RepID=UPI001F5ED6E3|nr:MULTISPECIES: hypothetical protein [unclassified Legionella]MDI9818690.1 hypothetical protein [Legionella sp. PL877]